MKQRNLKASELRGRNIYQLKNKTIYSDIFMKDHGYLITNYDAEKYYSYSLRGFESIFALVLLLLVTNSNFFLSFAVSITAYIVLTILFYVKFIPTLQLVPNFVKPKRDTFVVETAKDMSKGRILALSVVCASFGLLCLCYPEVNGYEGLFRTLLIALGGVALAFSVCYLIALFYKITKKVKDNDNK